MGYVFDLFYLLGIVLGSPWLLYKIVTTGKYRRGLRAKMTGAVCLRPRTSPCAWFHGVSVGEIHLLRQVVRAFRHQHPRWECVISTTTDTGYDEACKYFSDLKVFYWPLDFTWAVRRSLRRVHPALVVLAEGELWPNFLRAAQRAGAAVAVINARLSPRSFQRYRRLRPLVRGILANVNLFLCQNPGYADHFRSLGAEPARVAITGSVKYDGIPTDRNNAQTLALRQLLGVTAADRIWVAGSTQHPEEMVALDAFRNLKPRHPRLRLFLVPRQRERFDEVAGRLRSAGQGFIRRSEIAGPLPICPDVVLIDTIGELSAAWGLCELAFVGGSLDGKRGGQNMIEPAAYGAAVVFGPHVWNFREVADRLVGSNAAVQITDSTSMEAAVARLLDDPAEARRQGAAAQELIRTQQGATERTLDLLDGLLAPHAASDSAA